LKSSPIFEKSTHTTFTFNLNEKTKTYPPKLFMDSKPIIGNGHWKSRPLRSPCANAISWFVSPNCFLNDPPKGFK
jgi:glucan biosynthesis protein